MRQPVCFFAPQLSSGGSERQLFLLARGLRQRGWSIVVWCQRGAGSDTEIGRGLLAEGIPVTSASARRGIPAVLRVVELSSFFRRTSPRIVHSFGYGAHWTDAAAAALARVPAYVDSRRNIRHWDPDTRLRAGERLRNAISRMTIANCDAAATVAQRIEHLPAERVATIYNGVEVPERTTVSLSTPRFGFGNDVVIVGNLANLKAVKGQDLLLRAFATAVKKRPRLRLVLAGRGDFVGELGALIRELSLEKTVRLVGEQVASAFLPFLDIYAHASRAEGFSNSILEAMSYAKPVVALAVGGVPEAVVDGVTGRLVAVAEGELGLSEALVQLESDPDRRCSMGAAGMARVRERFSVSEMIDRHEDIYRRVADLS